MTEDPSPVERNPSLALIRRPALEWIGNLPTVRTADVRASIEYEQKRNERPSETRPDPRKDQPRLCP